MNFSDIERPPLDFMGPYNVPRSALPDYDGEIWMENAAIKRLSIREFERVRSDVITALSKHGSVYDGHDREDDFFVYEDKFFDRTQKIELAINSRCAEIIAPAVAELQRVLQKHRLWRVFFIGHGHPDQTREQFFVVYPEVILLRQLRPGVPIDRALVENARLRLSHKQWREDHQRRRNADLKKAVSDACAALSSPGKAPVVVAWFDSISALTWDWGWEGRAGTSVWLLLPNGVNVDTSDVSTNCEASEWWASPDGTFQQSPSRPRGAFRLLHLEDTDEVLEELDVAIDGRRQRLMRSKSRMRR